MTRPSFVRLSAVSKSCWFASVEIGGVSTNMLVDTGSSVSLLSKEIYETLSFRPILTEVADTLTTADGEPLCVYGKSIFPLRINEIYFDHPIVIADLGGLSGILGLDFLSHNEILVDTCKGILMSSKLKIQLYRENSCDQKCARVQISENIRIPPRSEMFITGNVKGSISDDMTCILEANNDQNGGRDVLIPKSLVNVTKSSVVFSVLNPTDNEVNLIKNKSVANLQAVDYILENDEYETSGKQNQDEMSINSNLPNHLKSLLTNVSNKLSIVEKNELENFLLQYSDIFVGPDGELGRTDLTAHKIDTGDAKPIKLSPRRLPIFQRDVAEREIESMLQKEVIKPSNSPWASPIVLVKKKDGSTRFCVDYRRLNSVTVKDAYPLPRVDESFDSLAGAKYFCTLDLASGYWQVVMQPEDRPKTAFASHKGYINLR